MPTVPNRNSLNPPREEVYVVNCIKLRADGIVFVQTFGPYSDYAPAMADCEKWHGLDGWMAEVDTIFPPAHKNSLLRPLGIGRG